MVHELTFVQRFIFYLLAAVGWYLSGLLSRPLSRKFFPSYRKLKPIAQRDWDIRIVSNSHGFFQIIMAFMFTPGYWTDMDIFLIGGAGYFTQDCILMLWYHGTPIYSLSSVLHHIMAVTVNLCSLFSHYFGTYIFLVGFEELSTPFVNQRWFLDAAKMKDTVFFAVNGACLFIVFLFIRVPFAFIFYHVMVHSIAETLAAPPAFVVILFIGIISSVLLNLYWSFFVTKGMVKHVLHFDVRSKQPKGGKKGRRKQTEATASQSD